MGTYPNILRFSKEKNWVSKSFFEQYNYSKLLYQDLYIENYIKNYVEDNINGSFIHNISIQRKKDVIHIFLDYYYVRKFLMAHNFINKSHKQKQFQMFRIKKKIQYKKNRKLYNFFIHSFREKKSLTFLPGSIMASKSFKSNNFFSLRKKLNSKGDNINIFSLKRLLILNLTFLTNCRVKIYTRNIAYLFDLPFFPRFSKNQKNLSEYKNIDNTIRYFPKYGISLIKEEFKNKSIFNSVKKIMRGLKIRWAVHRKVYGLDIAELVHIFCASFIFKNPGLLGAFISKSIKQNIRMFHLFFPLISRVIIPLYPFSSLGGLKIQFKGRLGASLRKRVRILQLGDLSLNKINANIKYSFHEVRTVNGICGIKIWYSYKK